MAHQFSVIGQKAKYNSSYGKAVVTIIIKDIIYTPFMGFRIQSENDNIYSIDEIEMLSNNY